VQLVGHAYVFELTAPRINKTFLIEATSDAELVAWLDAIETAAQSASNVSAPFNLEHRIHVDWHSASGLTGLPPAWHEQLLASSIPKASVIEHPDVRETVVLRM
jgi:hypothetical protein